MPFPANYEVIKMKKTFTKEERLCSKRAIDALFSSGSSFVIYPYRIVYTFTPSASFEVKVILSVSKRRFKRAHDRNRIKRLMREAYRLQKGDILYPSVEKKALNLHAAIQYIAKEELPYKLLDEKMLKVLNQLKAICNA